VSRLNLTLYEFQVINKDVKFTANLTHVLSETCTEGRKPATLVLEATNWKVREVINILMCQDGDLEKWRMRRMAILLVSRWYQVRSGIQLDTNMVYTVKVLTQIQQQC